MIRTFDADEINSVLKHPDIWPRIAGDVDIDEYSPPMDGPHYLYEDGVLFILHPEGDDWEIHANVLPESRGRAMQAASDTFDYAFNVLRAAKVVANIPQKYGNVYGFAKKFMRDDGVIDGDHRLSLSYNEWTANTAE